MEKTQVLYNGNMYDIEFEEIGPSIYVYRNALPQEMRIIDRVEESLAKPGSRFKWSEALVGFRDLDNANRLCKDWKIEPDSLNPRDEFSADALDLHNEIITRLKIMLEHYKPNNYLMEISYFEAINIVRYGKGEYFKVHTDDGDPYRCTVSAVGYPNDDYEGGDLWFPKFNLRYKPKAGDFVIFPSAFAYAHSSEPVTDEGIKYSLVIMTDRNKFANRHDSPIFHDPNELRKQGFDILGMK